MTRDDIAVLVGFRAAGVPDTGIGRLLRLRHQHHRSPLLPLDGGTGRLGYLKHLVATGRLRPGAD